MCPLVRIDKNYGKLPIDSWWNNGIQCNIYMVFFRSYVNVYQRVIHDNHLPRAYYNPWYHHNDTHDSWMTIHHIPVSFHHPWYITIHVGWTYKDSGLGLWYFLVTYTRPCSTSVFAATPPKCRKGTIITISIPSISQYVGGMLLLGLSRVYYS